MNDTDDAGEWVKEGGFLGFGGHWVFKPFDEPREYTDLEPLDLEPSDDTLADIDVALGERELPTTGHWEKDWIGRTVWREND